MLFSWLTSQPLPLDGAFLLNPQPLQVFSLPYPASPLGEPNGVLSTGPSNPSSPWPSASSFWALSTESVLSLTFSGCCVPCRVHAALQSGTTFSVSASASEEPQCEPCVCDQCGPSPCPTEADPDHHVSSVPSPNTWLGPVLQKAETMRRSVSIYQLCPTHLEEKGSLLPPEDQSPPVLSAIFLVSPVALSGPSLPVLLFPRARPLSPSSPLFPLSSSSSFSWFSTLFLRDALQSCGSCCSWNLSIPCDHRDPLLGCCFPSHWWTLYFKHLSLYIILNTSEAIGKVFWIIKRHDSKCWALHKRVAARIPHCHAFCLHQCWQGKSLLRGIKC